MKHWQIRSLHLRNSIIFYHILVEINFLHARSIQFRQLAHLTVKNNQHFQICIDVSRHATNIFNQVMTEENLLNTHKREIMQLTNLIALHWEHLNRVHAWFCHEVFHIFYCISVEEQSLQIGANHSWSPDQLIIHKADLLNFWVLVIEEFVNDGQRALLKLDPISLAKLHGGNNLRHHSFIIMQSEYFWGILFQFREICDLGPFHKNFQRFKSSAEGKRCCRAIIYVNQLQLPQIRFRKLHQIRNAISHHK